MAECEREFNIPIYLPTGQNFRENEGRELRASRGLRTGSSSFSMQSTSPPTSQIFLSFAALPETLECRFFCPPNNKSSLVNSCKKKTSFFYLLSVLGKEHDRNHFPWQGMSESCLGGHCPDPRDCRDPSSLTSEWIYTQGLAFSRYQRYLYAL